MNKWRTGDEEEEEGSLADTEADATQQSRDSGESLADTEADLTLIQEDRCSHED